MFAEMGNCLELSQDLLYLVHVVHGSWHGSSVFGQVNQEAYVTDAPVVGRGQPGFGRASATEDKRVVQRSLTFIKPLVQGLQG